MWVRYEDRGYSPQVRAPVAIRRGEQFMDWRIIGSPKLIFCKTITSLPPTSFVRFGSAIWNPNGPKSGRISTWAKFSISPASGNGR